MFIEGIVLEHFCVPTHTETAGTPQSCTRHYVFHSLLSDDSKQDPATTIAHRKCIIEMLNQRKIMTIRISNIWENMDGFDEHYTYDTALYLMSMLSPAYFIIIDHNINILEHSR